MEFIPIEKYSKKGKRKVTVEKETKVKKVQKNETIEKKPLRKGKIKPQRKIVQKKEVKKKTKEKITKKKGVKGGKKQKKTEEEEEDVEEEEEDEDVEMNESKEAEDGEESEECEEEEVNLDDEEDEESFRNKCKEMDDKKKNRLFLKLKKKILSEAQIKQLHPDIKSVIFPRKKRSRWCWAVFVSQEKANAAMKKLIKNKDVLVNKPTPYERVVRKRKEKMKTVLRKKEARKKLQKMWS